MVEYINKAELLWLMNETKEDRLTREVIENHPTIDIVHCYECMNGEIVNAGCNVWCNHLSFGFDKYHFCKWGERK